MNKCFAKGCLEFRNDLNWICCRCAQIHSIINGMIPSGPLSPVTSALIHISLKLHMPKKLAHFLCDLALINHRSYIVSVSVLGEIWENPLWKCFSCAHFFVLHRNPLNDNRESKSAASKGRFAFITVWANFNCFCKVSLNYNESSQSSFPSAFLLCEVTMKLDQQCCQAAYITTLVGEICSFLTEPLKYLDNVR